MGNETIDRLRVELERLAHLTADAQSRIEGLHGVLRDESHAVAAHLAHLPRTEVEQRLVAGRAQEARREPHQDGDGQHAGPRRSADPRPGALPGVVRRRGEPRQRADHDELGQGPLQLPT